MEDNTPTLSCNRESEAVSLDAAGHLPVDLPHMLDRRRFLSYLAASPVLSSQDAPDVIADPLDAINLMDFEPAAKKILPPAHYGYMATGVEDDLTLKANRAGFSRLYLRPRRLVDISKADLSIELFGEKWETPIGLAPVGNLMAFHPQGEMPVAKAARSTKTLQILSTMTNSSVASVNEALGRPAWYQLYSSSKWEITEELVHRADAAGTRVIAWTVDTQAGRRTETFERMRKSDKRECKACHSTTGGEFFRRKAAFKGIDMSGMGTNNPAQTWKYIERLRNVTTSKLLIKGIETHEDARVCLETGVDGVIVSNHGGRAGDSGRGTIDCLPEVVDAVSGRIPVLIDGGFRRGSDVFKALALGASAVFIGRPYVWGLSAFGQAGVERVIQMLRVELQLVMRQCGTRSIAEITPNHVGRF